MLEYYIQFVLNNSNNRENYIFFTNIFIYHKSNFILKNEEIIIRIKFNR